MSRKPRLGQVNPALGTLYSAPDVQEARRQRGAIAEIDPGLIDTDGRLDDRLDLDVAGLRESIARSGQRVPILVRPAAGDRYRLIYGRRRLEAARQLGRPVRAIVAALDDGQALRDQLLENSERRDLSFIERALVAAALTEGEFLPAGERTNRAVAEILNLTEAGVSQLLGVLRAVGADLVRAIGPAPGIGRPRWEDLKRALSAGPASRAALVALAEGWRGRADLAPGAASDRAFLAVLAAAKAPVQPPAPQPMAETGAARLRTALRGKRLKIEIEADDPAFLRWIDARAAAIVTELHARWRAEDRPNHQQQEARDR